MLTTPMCVHYLSRCLALLASAAMCLPAMAAPACTCGTGAKSAAPVAEGCCTARRAIASPSDTSSADSGCCCSSAKQEARSCCCPGDGGKSATGAARTAGGSPKAAGCCCDGACRCQVSAPPEPIAPAKGQGRLPSPLVDLSVIAAASAADVRPAPGAARLGVRAQESGPPFDNSGEYCALYCRFLR